MILLRELSIGYGKKVVARGINARLHQGMLTSLLGHNGWGKSTLLRTLSAFQPPLEGEILIRDIPLPSLSASERSRLIGVVLTDRLEVGNLRVFDLVALGRSPYTGFFGQQDEEDRQRVEEALEQVGILALKDRRVHTLSDGERQKAMIAKALAQHTPLILLDEPTAFLDFPSKVETMRLLRRLAHEMGKAILLSTHDVEAALQLSDRLWLLSPQGIQEGTPAELTRKGLLPHFFETPGTCFDAEGMTFRIEP